MLKKMLFLFLAMFMYSCVVSQASLVDVAVSQYGDMDMLNGSVEFDGSFNWKDLKGLSGEGAVGSNGGMTDTWIMHGYEDISWQQTGFSGVLEEVTSAFMFIGHGGFGINGAPVLSLFGQELGALSTSPSGVSENRYYVNIYDITGLAGRLLGENLDFSLAFPGFGDNGAIDFSTVVAFGTPAYATPVPEPGMLLLFGTGFIGLIGSQIRRKKEKMASKV